MDQTCRSRSPRMMRRLSVCRSAMMSTQRARIVESYDCECFSVWILVNKIIINLTPEALASDEDNL